MSYPALLAPDLYGLTATGGRAAVGVDRSTLLCRASLKDQSFFVGFVDGSTLVIDSIRLKCPSPVSVSLHSSAFSKENLSRDHTLAHHLAFTVITKIMAFSSLVFPCQLSFRPPIVSFFQSSNTRRERPLKSTGSTIHPLPLKQAKKKVSLFCDTFLRTQIYTLFSLPLSHSCFNVLLSTQLVMH